MNRREFLNTLKKPALALAAVPAIAVAAADRGRQAIDPHLQALKSKYENLSDRMDNMERSQKRMMKAMIVVTGVTLGIDISLLI
jgi:hypothetical protein